MKKKKFLAKFEFCQSHDNPTKNATLTMNYKCWDHEYMLSGPNCSRVKILLLFPVTNNRDYSCTIGFCQIALLRASFDETSYTGIHLAYASFQTFKVVQLKSSSFCNTVSCHQVVDAQCLESVWWPQNAEQHHSITQRNMPKRGLICSLHKTCHT